jgi:cytoskeletal protein CcmA (bactofilin family)
MKKLKLILLALVVMAVPLLALATTSYAGDFRSGNNTVIGKDEIIDRTLFISGNNVEINGEIKGDIFCAGQNITINARVSGDVLCAGMNIRVDGTVDGDVRVAGQVVVLAGTVARNASLAGNTITLDATGKVGNDLHAAGSAITLNGQVARDAEASGENIIINTMVGRHVAAATNNLTLGDQAIVKGDVTYYSNNKLHQAGGAQIAGKTLQKEPTQGKHQEKSANPLAEALTGGIAFLFMLLVLAMAVAALFPRMLHAVSDNAITKPGMTILIGLAACIAVPILIIGSFMIVVGIFLGVTLLLAWVLVMLLSGVFFSYYLGRLVFSRSPKHPLLTTFVGVLIVALLVVIPGINVLTMIAIALFGSGMVIRELLTRTPTPVYEAAAPVRPVKSKKKSA